MPKRSAEGFLEGAAFDIAVRMGSAGWNEKPLPGTGGVFLALYANGALALGDEIKFVLIEPVIFAFPGNGFRAEKVAPGVAHRIQIGKINFLQAFHFITSATFDKFLFITAIPLKI